MASRLNRLGIACLRITLNSALIGRPSCWWCQALNHAVRKPACSRSRFNMRITDDLPCPHSPVMASVRWGSVPALRIKPDSACTVGR